MNLKQFIWQELDKNGYVLDQNIFRFAKKDNCLCAASTYKQSYWVTRRTREHFEERIKKEKWKVSKCNGGHYLDFKEGSYKINKDYYDYLKSLKDN